MLKYKRILLKLSGEALAGDKEFGFSDEVLESFAKQIKDVHDEGVQIAIVIGGGNIFRGLSGTEKGVDRVAGDTMGMLATIMNGIALQNSIEAIGIPTRVLTSIQMPQIAEPYIRRRAIRHLEKGRVVIFAGGTGNPYFTTDTAATLRAIEIDADVIWKGTRVDGIYDSDPEKNVNAVKYNSLTFDEVYEKNLKVMDMTAFTLSHENKLPIIVFDMNKEGNLLKIVEGENIGTLVDL